MAEGVEYTDNLRQIAVELGDEIPTLKEAGCHQGGESEDIRDSEDYPDEEPGVVGF